MATVEEDEASYVSQGDGSKAPIQVEGGDEEADFRRSQQSSFYHIPRSTVHGRAPIMKHMESSEGEDKGILQEVNIVSGDRVSSIPEHLYRYPPDEEIVSFIPNVKRTLEEAIERFPNALGLCIAFSNEVGCERTERVSHIHNSSDTLCRTFDKLGYAACSFKNKHKIEILAVFKALADMTLPESYNALFIYYTGHGQKYYINTKDGYISINHLKDLLSAEKAPNMKDTVKVLIFDCCRTNVSVKSMSQTPSVDNMIIFYTTPLYQQSFIVDEAGMSVATIELIRLLDRHKSCHLTKLLSVDLCREVKRASGGRLRTDFEGSLDHSMDLFEEKMKAMSPRNVELVEDDERDVCVLQWTKPSHGKHQCILGYYIACKTRTQYFQGESWRVLKDDLTISVSSVEFPRTQVYGKRLTVAAKYSEIDVIAEDYGESPAVCLKSEALDPGEVQLTVTDIGAGVLTWSRVVSGDELEHVTIQRRFHTSSSSSSEEPERGWVDVTSRAPVEGHSYAFSDRRCAQFDYRMRLHVQGMSSDWVSAQKNLNNYGFYTHRVKPHCFKIVAIILSVILLVTSYCAMYGGVTLVLPHPTILALTGDVIDCERLDRASLKFFLSKLSLTQDPTDVVNDNPQGLDMKVKSFERSVILNARNFSKYYGRTNITLNKNYKNFIIPDGYYAYPPYMWAGSNITVQVNLSYKSPPDELLMYLIYGDQNYNTFSDDPSITPKYEQKFNLLGWNSQTYDMTVKNNGYYYVVIYVKTDNDIHFSAEVNFNYYSVFKENLDLKDALSLSTVGTTLHVPLDYHNQHIVICAVEDNSDDGAYTIHLHLRYSLRALAVYTLPLVVMALPICVLISIAVKKLICYFYYKSKRRHYQRIPDHSLFAVNS